MWSAFDYAKKVSLCKFGDRVYFVLKRCPIDAFAILYYMFRLEYTFDFLSIVDIFVLFRFCYFNTALLHLYVLFYTLSIPHIAVSGARIFIYLDVSCYGAIWNL